MKEKFRDLPICLSSTLYNTLQCNQGTQKPDRLKLHDEFNAKRFNRNQAETHMTYSYKNLFA